MSAATPPNAVGTVTSNCYWPQCPRTIKEYREKGFTFLSKTRETGGTVKLKFRKPESQEVTS